MLYSMLDAAVVGANVAPSDVTIVHGACPSGADEIAGRWAASRMAGVEKHPADWNAHGQSAGFKRNMEMVQTGPDLCVAFLMPCTSEHCTLQVPHASHGAAHCLRVARAAGVPTTEMNDGW